eukprot:2090411-Rhodomonas_salina.1
MREEEHSGLGRGGLHQTRHDAAQPDMDTATQHNTSGHDEARPGPRRATSDQIRHDSWPDQTRADQIRSDQIRSERIRSDQSGSDMRREKKRSQTWAAACHIMVSSSA